MRLIDKLLPEIKNECIPAEILSKLAEAYGERFFKALRTILEKRVMKYTFVPSGRVAWIVVGKKRDYITIGTKYCNCDDFYMNVMNAKSETCYHLLARLLAEPLNLYKNYEVSDEQYRVLMKEWRNV
ncbi:MAG: hypothetical protein ACXQS8_01830 [Candidatus Helarchaeales archaeon]